MKRSIILWQIGGATFVGVVGTLLHFLYDWSGKSIILAPISAVNESTWEHMKIMFFPMLIYALIQANFFAKDYQNYWTIKCIGTLAGTLLVPFLFYLLNQILGKTPDWLNVLIFFVSLGIAFLLEGLLFKHDFATTFNQSLAIWVLGMSALAFVFFTFYPPKLPIFLDPVSRQFGIPKA